MKPASSRRCVRVSTSEPDTGLHETELRQYVESRGWDGFCMRTRLRVARKMIAGVELDVN